MSRWAALGLALGFILPALAASAADAPAQLGRVASVAGTVSTQADASSAPSGAAPNTALTTGNMIAVKPRSHAAIDIGAARLHLDGGTLLEIGPLNPGTSSVLLKSGAVVLHILPGGEGQVFSVATPTGVFQALQPGFYEVEITESGSRATALQGGAQFGGVVLRSGTRASIAAGVQAAALETAAEDDFVRRVLAEMDESGESRFEAPQHVSPQMTGFQDLANYGLWVSTERLGWVWEPQVGSDWTPRSEGESAAAEPWRFATTHYGSWAQVNSRWVWVPGSVAQSVTVFDAQTRSSHAGWVALGPEEPHPAASSPVIINNIRVVNPPPKVVNVTTVNNTTNVTNVVHEDREPSLVVIGTPVVNPPPPPPPPPPSTPSNSIPNRTGLGAAGTPIGGGVAFPGGQ